MINTRKEVVIGHKSGHIVAYGRDFGEVVNSIKLDFPINFLFENLMVNMSQFQVLVCFLI